MDMIVCADGAYVVSKRTLFTYTGGKGPGQSSTDYFLNNIIVEGGKIVPNDHYSGRGFGEGGARYMKNGKIALTYFSVFNNGVNPSNGQPIGLDINRDISIKSEVIWALYIGKLPNEIDKEFNLREGNIILIGGDEGVHARRCSKVPRTVGKDPVATGKIEGEVFRDKLMDGPEAWRFSSPNYTTPPGPNRPDGDEFFMKTWHYDNKKWILKKPTEIK